MSNDPHRYEDYWDEPEGEDERCDLCGLALDVCTCMECGVQQDGSCALAGSEFCDWVCKTQHRPQSES